MTTNDERARKLAELTRLLDAWGGEAGRWPQDKREHIRTLAAELPEGARLLAEAKALDRALNAATFKREAAAERALASRIVAAAIGAERPGTQGTRAESPGQIIPLPVARDRNSAADARRPPRTSPKPALVRKGWQAAALLAACLLSGIYLGGSVNLNPVLQDLADAFGIPAEFEVAATGLGDEESP